MSPLPAAAQLGRELGHFAEVDESIRSRRWALGESSEERRQYLAMAAWGVAAIVEIHGNPWSDLRPLVTVGTPEGQWDGPSTLRYCTTVPKVLLPTPLTPDGVAEFGQALNDATDERITTLLRCQFCKQQVPPEHRLNDHCCYGCGSTQFGIVY